ncbi:MAG: nickel pincer cofactor biosynthesis protein LarC [Armatimonadetes bacterium]|nr:nickel pincer cofactor biosynthesis protein LarC [Armatimonadota bacterium]NIO75130.1 nickel pincer cofactor biosynthesis protein LarC [Armatimonadota bacterium]NIO95754.1 nickel pincer cofactor biosynthesis protein LarC [Armatimonadota bacterium]
MRIAYLDCLSGISGNMLLGALVELGVGKEALCADLAELGLTGWNLEVKQVKRGALSATLVEVEVAGPQPRRTLSDILSIISDSALPAPIKEKAKDVFTRLASVEAQVHGQSEEEIHFHEVGAVDALVDVVGTVAGFHRLGVERIYCSPLPVPRGWVNSAHGDLPLPAPAAALLLRNVPSYGVESKEELVTPTGAALAVSISEAFGPQPPMTVEAVGCGAGSREFARPNVLRVFLGEVTFSEAQGMAKTERLALLETNIDDMNPELCESLMERLFAAGALDAYLTPIIMKKGRPGVIVSALCNLQDRDEVYKAFLGESTTLGVRVSEIERCCLEREFREVETRWGKVKIKVARSDNRVIRAAPEYEDCRRLAKEHNVLVREVYDEAKARAWLLFTNEENKE